ncbi:Signal recognition particle receptor FtsY [hydrothermal vent metagenome]|uniref:Signal recognition particle receptor FtsY n=1 Tax=hydrothermal vent metagenome TaxID=652676 RepID=A0A3B0WD14_9ZZZZ
MFGFLRRKKDKDNVSDEAPAQAASTPVDEADSNTASAQAQTVNNKSPAPTDAPASTEKTDAPLNSPKSPQIQAKIKSGSSFTPPSAEKKPQEQPNASKQNIFNHLKSRLNKTRSGLTDGMADLLLGKKTIDEDLLEELEARLLTADVGVEATSRIITDLTQRISRKELQDPVTLFNAVCDDMVEILQPVEQPLVINEDKTPFVILVIGINGAGKTTTIGKLAKRFQNQGKTVMLAAGDTFRAAAVEQLQTWGERNNIHVASQGTGADSASVIFDAIESAASKNIDVVIADTAGRLHTQSHLMDELIKIKRVMQKLDNTAPHETLLVLDAGFGQNGLIQAQQFNDAMGLTGLVLTKLDGTAKGGILFAIAEKLGIPIRFIGVGESIDDLREFHATEFVDALLDKEQPDVVSRVTQKSLE